MADYKYSHFLTNTPDPRFDPAHPPGAVSPHSGIYKCQGCGCEVVARADEQLPALDHHQHAVKQGGIAWRLAVAVGS